MIIESFVLHVYCRNDGKYTGKPSTCCAPYRCSQAEFSGDNKRAARADARRYGWVFEGRDVTCPSCVRRRKESKS